MKRTVGLLLLVAMLVGLCACGGGGDTPKTTEEPQTTAATEAATAVDLAVKTMNEATEFSVGYSRIDITPQTSVPMAGFGRSSERMSQTFLDNLYATALAMTDGEGNTVVLIGMDLQRASDDTVKAVRPLISQVTGIPESRISFSGTHTHSGPDLLARTHPAIISYVEYLNPRLLQVALEALADMKPAQLYAGSAETEGLNFVRHYTYTNADGETLFFGDNFGTEVLDSTTAHATQPDTTMHLLKITREGQKDIVVANWRAHATLTGGRTKYDLSADYVGSFRTAIEKQANCQFLYFQGAAGNMNAKSRISAENQAMDYLEHGYLLSQYAMEGLANAKKIETGTIRTAQELLILEVNHADDPLYYKAKEIHTFFTQSGDMDMAKQMGAPFGIRSPYHAEMIAIRYGKPETMDVEINAICIGDSFALTTAPNELFDTLIEDLGETAPFENLMFLGYSNGQRGYIPSAYGFEYTCYESDCCYFKPGCGEAIRDTMLKLLTDIKTAE